MKKKGSLNMSIEVIIIVVIAMTLMSLALPYIRGIFGGLEKQTDTVFSTVEAEIKDKLTQTNEPLYFPSQKISIGAEDEKVDGIGIKNTGDTTLNLKAVFQIRIGDQFVDFIPGKIQNFGSGDESFTAGMDWDNSLQKFSAGEGRPIVFTLTAPSKFGNYLYKIKIVKDDDTEYASKTYFVRTS